MSENRRTLFEKPGPESDCLLGHLCRILEISDSEAGLKVEKLRGVVGGGLSVGTPRRS